jgi:hypothetical protein
MKPDSRMRITEVIAQMNVGDPATRVRGLLERLNGCRHGPRRLAPHRHAAGCLGDGLVRDHRRHRVVAGRGHHRHRCPSSCHGVFAGATGHGNLPHTQPAARANVHGRLKIARPPLPVDTGHLSHRLRRLGFGAGLFAVALGLVAALTCPLSTTMILAGCRHSPRRWSREEPRSPASV